MGLFYILGSGEKSSFHREWCTHCSRDAMSNPDRPWTQYLFAVRDLTLGDPMAKLVMYGLASRVDRDGYCYPSINRIVKDTDLSRRTVQRRLDLLSTLGLINCTTRRRVDSPGYHDTTVFRLTVPTRHYPTHAEPADNVPAVPELVSRRHPNLPVTNYLNSGVPQTLGEDDPPADASDAEHRRRIAQMASEVADRLRGGRR